MIKPKPPIGFVPVDSEEAKLIPDFAYVNCARTTASGTWEFFNQRMDLVRGSSNAHAVHVQLMPTVEWKEVWGWKEREDGVTWITYNGVPFENIGNRAWTFDQLNTIVRALNDMEGRDG